MEELLKRGDKNFIGCEPTVKFIRKINDLVNVLNSNTEKHSLQANPNSNTIKVDNIHIYLSILKKICFFFFLFRYSATLKTILKLGCLKFKTIIFDLPVKLREV